VRLETLHIRNLRSCKNVTILFNAYTCLVGPNGAGKSTVLTALNIIQPLAIANAMRIPTLVVLDSDGHNYGIIDPTTDPEGKKAGPRAAHVRDNTAILRLTGAPTTDPFPTTTLFHERVVMWHS